MRFLVGEDDAAHQQLLQMSLREFDADAEVTSVRTGSEFLQCLRNDRYDLGLLDYHLPDGHADDVLARLGSQRGGPPIVVLSAAGDRDTVTSCLRGGRQDFMPKEEAFVADRLKARLRDVLVRGTVESRVGGGSTVQILLPQSGDKAALSPNGKTSRPVGTGTVLVVDDEPFVRHVAGKCLEHGGYSVLYAEDGPSALDVYRERSGRIDLVLLDMHMPRMGGAEVYAALRKMDPDARVLISSGYDQKDTCKALARLEPPAGFIEKPYTFTTLMDKIAEALERRTAASPATAP